MKTKFKINIQKMYSKIKNKTSKIQNIVANFLQKLVTKLHLGTLCKKIGLEFIYKKCTTILVGLQVLWYIISIQTIDFKKLFWQGF